LDQIRAYATGPDVERMRYWGDALYGVSDEYVTDGDSIEFVYASNTSGWPFKFEYRFGLVNMEIEGEDGDEVSFVLQNGEDRLVIFKVIDENWPGSTYQYMA